MTTQMSRGPIIFGFWLLGYALGFAAYMIRAPFLNGLYDVFGSANANLVGGLVSGLAGSVLMLVGLFVWSHWGNHS